MSILRDPSNAPILKAAVRHPMKGTRLNLKLDQWGREPQRLGVAVDLAIRTELARRMAIPLEHPRVIVKGLALLGSGRSSGLGANHDSVETAIAFDEAFERLQEWAAGHSADMTPALVSDCLLLAGLEMYVRSGYPEALTGDLVTDTQYVLNALEIAPWDSLCGDHVLLNPTFGEGSISVGGADADLFRDGSLIEIKAVKSTGVPVETVRQLAAYGVLARHFGIDAAPEALVERVGLYHVRSGVLLEWGLDDCFSDGGSEMLLDVLTGAA